MKTAVLIVLNGSLLLLFGVLLRKRGLLTFIQSGRVWLTWLAVAIITLMDEFTSIFYASAEAYRFIGPSAIVFILITSVLIRFMSNRFTEIAEILERHNLIGGGVYSFSYLVLGPAISFIAVSSIMVDYILTACISAVSAALNAGSFFPSIAESGPFHIPLVIGVIWGIAGLNITGIRENARFTFLIFIFASFAILNLIASGLISLDNAALERIKESGVQTLAYLDTGSWTLDYGNFISHVAFCILAYSGIESLIQTAGFVKNWRQIHRAYVFLALTVGIVTPLVSALALSAPIDFAQHEGDLITHYATLLHGAPFGVIMATLASLTLIMAVNTAFVASSELIERVAQRYGFRWLIVVNRRNSLYRIHILSAVTFSVIILITSGSQKILADMYALGLLASFSINMGALLIYRYFQGTKEVTPYFTSRLGTLVLWVILVSCFVFLAIEKPYGTTLWVTVTAVVLTCGIALSRKRGPEIVQIEKAEDEMQIVHYLARSPRSDLHVFFQRPREEAIETPEDNEAYVTFFSPRQRIPFRMGPNHFRLPLLRGGLYQHILALIKALEHEMPGRCLTVHFGWPMSSWLDRLSIGVMVFNLMRLPRIFPRVGFVICYHRRTGAAV